MTTREAKTVANGQEYGLWLGGLMDNHDCIVEKFGDGGMVVRYASSRLAALTMPESRSQSGWVKRVVVQADGKVVLDVAPTDGGGELVWFAAEGVARSGDAAYAALTAGAGPAVVRGKITSEAPAWPQGGIVEVRADGAVVPIPGHLPRRD